MNEEPVLHLCMLKAHQFFGDEGGGFFNFVQHATC